MEFNKYAAYGYIASEQKALCKNKIFSDLERLKHTDEYADVCRLVEQIFGKVEQPTLFKYPNDVEVCVRPKDEAIEILAWNGEKQIMGEGWYLVDADKVDSV